MKGKRARYLAALAKPGATLATVAKKFGVSRQAVSQARNAEATRLRNRRTQAANRRAAGAVAHPCRKCGGVGHYGGGCTGKGIRCQFCTAMNGRSRWIKDRCPNCGRQYDPALAQEGDD